MERKEKERGTRKKKRNGCSVNVCTEEEEEEQQQENCCVRLEVAAGDREEQRCGPGFLNYFQKEGWIFMKWMHKPVMSR